MKITDVTTVLLGYSKTDPEMQPCARLRIETDAGSSYGHFYPTVIRKWLRTGSQSMPGSPTRTTGSTATRVR